MGEGGIFRSFEDYRMQGLISERHHKMSHEGDHVNEENPDPRASQNGFNKSVYHTLVTSLIPKEINSEDDRARIMVL